MAKWGEGDPRWIVEERPDATNVNNWHWTEKNATPWSKERLQELFHNFEIKQNDFICTVDGVNKITGEATVNNRKGKLIFFYEWDIVYKWTGKLPNAKETHKGKISIPNLSEENDLDDIEITITIDESNDDSEKLKLFMYNYGREQIRKQLGVYIKELKEEYSKNLILPKVNSPSSIPDDQQKAKFNSLSNGVLADASSSATKKSATLGCKLDVKSLEMSIIFHCSPNDLYNSLTKQEMITAFTNGPVKIDASRGGEFSFYGGNVHGKFEELIPEKKIKQSWRLKSWPSGHFSDVTIDIEEGSGGTKLSLKQTGIPATEYDSMHNNWNRYYWSSIKHTFGFGASIADAF